MILDRLNNQSKTVTGAAIIIASATLLSKIIGLIRDRVLAHYFGAGEIMDAYYAAFKIPDLIYTLLIVGALTAGFIPTFTKLFYSGEEKSPAWRLANNIFNIGGLVIAVLSIVGMVFAPWLIPVVAPGFSEASRELTVSLTRIMFISPLFFGLSMTLGGVLQSLGRFVFYSIAPIFYNLGIIVGAVFLVKLFGPIGLAWGVVLGAALHCSLQMIGARGAGWRWHWQFDLKDAETRLVAKLMIPRTLGLAITELNVFVVTILASLLPIGSVAVYNYANNLQAVPTGIIGIPFALAVFPLLSAAAARNNSADFLKYLSSTARQILFLVIPMSVIILLLRAQIVRVVLGSGAFDWSATTATADALAFFAFGLFAQSLIPLLARSFYSLSDTKTPFVIGVITELIAIIAALILMRPLGVAGLALASSVGAVLNMTLLVIYLRKATGGIEGEKLIASLYRISIAAIAMAVVIQFLKYPLAKIFDMNYFFGVLGQGLVAGLIGFAVYGFICWLLKVPEFVSLKEAFERRWLKLRNITTTELIETKE
ncbi:MAG: murein biosynthesis integral membrane protein MurJ [Candidatus Magasanikbacteria bacterium]|nr:murein biosynthesis integral membrane protein MurJ [Candidatus Magasanikbacteria bacterium]